MGADEMSYLQGVENQIRHVVKKPMIFVSVNLTVFLNLPSASCQFQPDVRCRRDPNEYSMGNQERPIGKCGRAMQERAYQA